MRRPHRTATLVAAAMLLAAIPLVQAQAPGGGNPGDGLGNGPGSGIGRPDSPAGGMPPGMEDNGRMRGPHPGGRPGGGGMMRNGLQVGPPGRWWDDKDFVQELNLKPEQQKRMDAIFNENRGTLATHFQALQDEEAKMQQLSHAATPQEEALFAQIDRLSQAHASLEKALTHYLFRLRGELNADQVARLQSHR